MTKKELATEAWEAWIKDKPTQSEDMARGFKEGFNFCLLGKVKIECNNLVPQEKLTEAKEIITALLNIFVYNLTNDNFVYDLADNIKNKAEQFLKENQND